MKAIVLSICVTVVVCACGKSPSGKKDPGDGQSGDASTFMELCPDGGTFAWGPITLTVPSGAVAECTTLVIEPWANEVPGNLGQVYHLFLADGTLLKGAELAFDLPVDDVPAPYQHADVKLARIVDDRWQPLPASQADSEAELVAGPVAELGIFGAVPRVKLDILFATENGVGMCDFHRVMAHHAPDWIRELNGHIPLLDVQAAVVTRDAWTGTAGFADVPAQSWYPACWQSRWLECTSDEDCQAQLGPNWECTVYGPDVTYNLNGSVNSRCTFRCNDSANCWDTFCTDGCGGIPHCPSPLCETTADDSLFQCESPGTVDGDKGCIVLPLTESCPTDPSPIVAYRPDGGIDSLDTVRCNLRSVQAPNHTANLDAVFAAALRVLDPDGPNQADAQQFLRDDARLLVIFLAYDDECSIAPEFASPNFTCETDDDCSGGLGRCRTDVYFSTMKGKQIKLCEGLIKKDYYNRCALLGEFQGDEHHSCAYDLDCQDCTSDSDCPKYWYCKQDKKCRPETYSLHNVATYQTPPGTPIFSLLPVAEFKTRLEGLKQRPEDLLVGAIVGDGVVQADDAASYVSKACLDHESLEDCKDYLAVKQESSQECLADPTASGCEALFQAKLHCIRACYVASLGNPEKPTASLGTKMCIGPYGPASGGNRYVRLVESLGDRGSLTSYCDPAGIPAGLARIKAMVLASILGQ